MAIYLTYKKLKVPLYFMENYISYSVNRLEIFVSCLDVVERAPAATRSEGRQSNLGEVDDIYSWRALHCTHYLIKIHQLVN